jgi:hypothetical protein
MRVRHPLSHTPALHEKITSHKLKESEQLTVRFWAVVHVCNPSHLGGLRFEVSLGKKLARLHLNK